jgi:hypothetical protein
MTVRWAAPPIGSHASVHHLVPDRAVHMHVDETGRYQVSGG